MTMGIYISGRLKGYSEKPWDNGSKQGVNRRVGIVTNSYKDEWGGDQEDVTLVDVSPTHADQVKAACEQYQGKDISLLVGARARTGGPQGAWLSFFMLKASQIIPQSVKKAA